MSAAGAYFPGDEPGLSTRLDAYLAGLAGRLGAAGFASSVSALLLAGGYGRGEGGVFRATPGGEAELYNDLEFYLLLKDPAVAPAAAAWCAQESHAGDAALGIEVEFKLLPAGELAGASPSMFYYDLVAAHRLVWGDPAYAAAWPARLRDPALIPAHEAVRLLFNRGSGLFFSRCALEAADARVGNGFIERNQAKVRLALADAVLALNGRYHHSCRERARRLGSALPHTPPDWARLVAWHAAGVEFKLHPRHVHPSAAELAAALAEMAAVWERTFLWLETRHLDRAFASARDYAAAPGRLFPHVPAWRGALLHGRDRVRRGGALPGWRDYPRAALQRALVLLVAPEAGASERALAARIISAGEPTWSALEAAYVRWWRWYN
jgi:hypothetical protein